MTEFLKENAVWMTPVLVAMVSGIFYLVKKGGKSNKQTIKNVKDIRYIRLEVTLRNRKYVR